MKDFNHDLPTIRAIQNKERMEKIIPSVCIPEGEIGDAKITHFEIKEEDIRLANVRMLFDGQGHRAYAPGKYTRLVADGHLQMSDTVAEKLDHEEVVRVAEGDCLVMGLGLGMVANAMAQKPQVRSVTVIEINPNVIALVAPTLHEKVSVIEADAMTWQPPKGKKWDVIWHDIWPTISIDDCESRAKLSRRFARRWTKYHGAWAKDEVRRQQKEANRGWW